MAFMEATQRQKAALIFACLCRENNDRRQESFRIGDDTAFTTLNFFALSKTKPPIISANIVVYASFIHAAALEEQPTTPAIQTFPAL